MNENHLPKDVRLLADCFYLKGVTLLEVLLSLALISIVAGMTIPTFTDIMENMQQNSTMRKLYTALKLARSEAIKYNQEIRLCPSKNGESCLATTDWNRGWIIYVDANTIAKLDEEDKVLHIQDQISTATLRYNLDDYSVKFRKDGRISRNASFYICSKQEKKPAKRLVLIHSGRIRITDADPEKQGKYCVRSITET